VGSGEWEVGSGKWGVGSGEWGVSRLRGVGAQNLNLRPLINPVLSCHGSAK